jgi:hypothetical protein
MQLPGGIRALADRYPWTVRLVWGAALVLVAGDAFLGAKGIVYARETSRLRTGMSANERARLDAALISDSNRLQVIIELARRQASVDNGLHLTVALDSGVLSLEQEGATLRTLHAEIGPDSWVRTGKRDSLRITAPRGERTIEQLLGDTAVLLSGGALIYARVPGDSLAARSGSVRVEANDLRIIGPSLKAGQRVYFY